MSDPLPAKHDRVRARHIDRSYDTLRTAIRVGGAVAIAYFGFDALKQFAGESTKVDVALSLLLSAVAELKVIILLSLAAAACAWGFMERALRHRTIRHLQGRIREL